jgi:adenylate kinase family enzyme
MLTILSGLPGSGLTTKAKELMKENPNMVRISRYELSQSLFQGINGHLEDTYVGLLVDKIIETLTTKGMDLVIDDMNLDKDLIKHYKRLKKSEYDNRVLYLPVRSKFYDCVDNYRKTNRMSLIPNLVCTALEYNKYPKPKNGLALVLFSKPLTKENIISLLDLAEKNIAIMFVSTKTQDKQVEVEKNLSEVNAFSKLPVHSLFLRPKSVKKDNMLQYIKDKYFVGKEEWIKETVLLN